MVAVRLGGNKMSDTVTEKIQQIDEELLDELLMNEEIDLFRNAFLKLHPYDQALYYKNIDIRLREKIYHYLSPQEIAGLFEHLEVSVAHYQRFLLEMSPNYAADMFASMYADNAVDILNELDKEQLVSYLTLMEKEAADEIKGLLHYEESTAGSIMTTEFIAISANQTVQSAMAILKKEAPRAETIYYVFVINDDKQLVGVISLRDLIVSEDHITIAEVMNERVFSVSVSEDQRDVARKMKDYNFLALPVVDFQNHLLGIITVDDIIDVIDEEASDDYSKLAAVTSIDTMDKNSLSAAKKRLPWLIILLILGMLTASLIGRFEETLNQVAILAMFIPLIAGMAGNTGTQALAVAVRGLATGEIERESRWKIIFREAGTGMITGLTCGILVMLFIYIWKGQLFLGLLVGISIIAALFVATLAGTIVPLVMHRVKIDPAVASGPFITTVNDLISIFIYFQIATLFIERLL